VFNVTVLAKNIEDIKQNTTRFLVFAKQQLTATQLGDKPCLTTLLFETEHKSGALVKVLQVFEKHRLNITKLETYMVGHEKPNPSFYIDVASNLYGQAMQDTLDDIRNFTTGIKILGCYAASANRRGNSPFLSVASS
jgi:prephenate dehydratase